MLNVRLAGGNLYGKQLFTWLSLVVSLMASFCAVLFFPRRDIGLSMSVRSSFRPSIRSHFYVTAERNFMKLILNMYHYNDVMHVKFGPAGRVSS